MATARIPVWAIVLGAWVLSAQNAPKPASARDPDGTLAQVREKLATLVRRLPRYTCVQTVDRQYFGLSHRMNAQSLPAASCDRIIENRKNGSDTPKLEATDRLRLEVAVSNGHEIYSWANSSEFDSRQIHQIVGEGATSTGEFGTFLSDIFDNPGTKFSYEREASAGGRALLEFSYRVPVQASHYRVRADLGLGQGADSWHTTGYEGSFSIDPESMELVRLTIQTDRLPPTTEICQATTALEYQRVRIGAEDVLLPRSSQLHIVSRNARETINVTTFSGCRQYGAESTLRFGDEPADANSGGKDAAAARVPLPAWLPITLALVAPIDTGAAAAGDLVTARVAQAVRAPNSKTILVPAGATVLGRITTMEHHLTPKNYFLIGMAFDTLEVNGVASPFHALLDVKHESVLQIEVSESRPEPPKTGALFPFSTKQDRLVVPVGYKTMWVTGRLPDAKR
ncbi:MAG: hypothetical protein LAQ69_20375 [Acidobacteriia bacterium]|nr:hypothetical protein [Terriglobia bacterium]